MNSIYFISKKYIYAPAIIDNFIFQQKMGKSIDIGWMEEEEKQQWLKQVNDLGRTDILERIKN